MSNECWFYLFQLTFVLHCWDISQSSLIWRTLVLVFLLSVSTSLIEISSEPISGQCFLSIEREHWFKIVWKHQKTGDRFLVFLGVLEREMNQTKIMLLMKFKINLLGGILFKYCCTSRYLGCYCRCFAVKFAKFLGTAVL